MLLPVANFSDTMSRNKLVKNFGCSENAVVRVLCGFFCLCLACDVFQVRACDILIRGKFGHIPVKKGCFNVGKN